MLNLWIVALVVGAVVADPIPIAYVCQEMTSMCMPCYAKWCYLYGDPSFATLEECTGAGGCSGGMKDPYYGTKPKYGDKTPALSYKEVNPLLTQGLRLPNVVGGGGGSGGGAVSASIDEPAAEVMVDAAPAPGGNDTMKA